MRVKKIQKQKTIVGFNSRLAFTIKGPAVKQTNSVKTTTRFFSGKSVNIRESIFRRCYDYALTLGKSLAIEPNMRRIAGRQIHRASTLVSNTI